MELRMLLIWRITDGFFPHFYQRHLRHRRFLFPLFIATVILSNFWQKLAVIE